VSEEKTDGEEKVHVIDEDGSLDDFDSAEGDSPEASTENEDPRAELEQAKKDFLYLKAEFDNFKKRTLKERSDLLKYGGERIFVEILEVVDNFERALSTEVNAENFDQFVSGINMIHTSLTDTMKRLGVTEKGSLGEDFDPNIHEALGTEPTPDMEPGKVSQVVRKPYLLHDRIIRPGQVIVAKEPEENNSSDE